uniref:DUF7042 domain-containing protein n=1 Tax=Anopheles melas TaxID=34690 RepID=A0A182TSH7_9DIPT
MFKINPEPIKCPLSVEELTCLAWWKDGNSRYLVGLVSHHHATSNEERFRCFVYEKLSGSANNSETQLCPLEGQYMMKGFLMPTSSISRHKRNHNNKARSHRHWDVVGYRNQESAIAGSNAGTVGGIVGGYIGLEAKRRSFLPRSRRTAADSRNDTTPILHGDNGVATDGTARLRRETAGGCNINHNTNRQLLVGCSEESVIEVKPKCKIDDEELFICTGHWQENQTTYIIAKHSISQHGVCISYVPMEGNHVQLFVGDTCHRAYMQSGQHRSMPANITSYGITHVIVTLCKTD